MLPQIKHPIFTLNLPVSKKKIKFRPMLVKEEKMLLLAKESFDDEQIIENLKAVIQNCVTEKLDFDNIPLAEVEFIFINIRSKSINNIISILLADRYEPTKKHKIEIDLDKITIDFKNIDRKIKLEENLGVVLRYPTINVLNVISSSKQIDTGLTTFKLCLETVYDNETSYKIKDIPDQEVEKFIDNLSSKHMELINNFFNNIPRLHYDVNFINSKGENDTIILEKFTDFFT